MGSIETTYDLPNDLTIIKATGRMVADDIFSWSADYYTNGEITTLHLWDITEADLSQITPEHIIEDSRRTARMTQVRRGGMTAVVASMNTLEFGLSRMSEALHEIELVPIEYRLFTSMNEAMEWLFIGDNTPHLPDD